MKKTYLDELKNKQTYFDQAHSMTIGNEGDANSTSKLVGSVKRANVSWLLPGRA